MHERFRYKTGNELKSKAKELGYDLPFTDDISPLLSPMMLEGFLISNRFVVQPMEGYDSEPDGSPSHAHCKALSALCRGRKRNYLV